MTAAAAPRSPVAATAAYILKRIGPMASMKLHRLCYYANGYHLAREGRALFGEHFEAWANGPVVSALYELHRGRFLLDVGDIPGDPGVLDDGERESIDAVLAVFGHFDAHDLSLMTHCEPPWILARQRAGLGILERGSEALRIAEIAGHFKAMAAHAGSDGQ